MTGVLLASTIGLLPGSQAVGAGDNGDGSRLYCGVGLSAVGAPASEWQGGVILDFSRSAPCSTHQPSSAFAVMRVAAFNQDPFSLRRLGWLYSGLFATVATIAGCAVAARRFISLSLLLPPIVPLFDPDFARFLISTYAEPAGLLGAFAMVCGVAVAACTHRHHRAERFVAIFLIGSGGLMAGLAKLAYVPVLAVATVVLATVPVCIRSPARGWTAWLAGPSAAMLTAAAAVLPINSARAWQAETYGSFNTHNFVYGVVLTEFPGSTSRLGLPARASDSRGDAYLPNGPAGVAGADLVAANPDHYRTAGSRLLIQSPVSLARVVGIALQATIGRSLTYLPNQPWTTASTPPTLGRIISGAQGADSRSFRPWLDAMSRPWMPSLLTALGAVFGVISVRWRRHRTAAFAKMSGICAASALGLAVVAVFGDGYFEIAKHVWLAAYFLDVTLLALLGVVIATLEPLARRGAIAEPPCPSDDNVAEAIETAGSISTTNASL